MKAKKTIVDETIAKLRGAPGYYHPSANYLCSVISTWSYSDGQTVSRVLGRPNWWGTRKMTVEPFRVHNPALPVDANAYLIGFGPAGEAGLYVLAFRGTEPANAVDWLTDALIEPHQWVDDQWVHRGFFLSVDVLWPELWTRLRKLSGHLLITGHSLGGAMAALAARRFADELIRLGNGDGPDLELCGTYTFGQPMVGNDAFARACDGMRLFRHVYNGDLVPRLPPTPLAEGYRHFGVAFSPGPEGSGPDISTVTSSDWPPPCILSDLVPAALSLVTARSPLVRELLDPLMAWSELPGSVSGWLTQLAKLKWPEANHRCSMDDHIPTHYVDVSRTTAQERVESADVAKPPLRWIAHE